MTQTEIQKILNLHKKWLNNEKGGVRADFSGANLSRANLRGANFRWANLSRADLSKADLYEANLSGANLEGTNLRGANLYKASLSRADLYEANLSWVDLSEANLRGADLSRADLRKANLSWANLSWADLRKANLSEANLSKAYLIGANLYKANLSGANLSPYLIVPPKGAFRGYKRLTNNTICELLIPEEAARVSTPVGRKCRAEYVLVISGSGTSDRGGVYTPGEITRPDSYDPDPRIECSHGIHFYLTHAEAEEYSG